LLLGTNDGGVDHQLIKPQAGAISCCWPGSMLAMATRLSFVKLASIMLWLKRLNRHCSLADFTNNRFSTSNIEDFANSASHDGARKWGGMGDGAARGISFVFTDDPKCLFATVIPSNGDLCTELNVTCVRIRCHGPLP
jgi:hypothetical protein